MEKMIKDRIMKKMIVSWSVITILLGVFIWIIVETLDFDFSLAAFMSGSAWRWAFVIVAVVLLVWLIRATVNAFRFPNVLNEFYIMNNMSKKAVEEEFARCTELKDGFWVSPILTVYFDGMNFGIFKNAKLSRVKLSVLRGGRGRNAYFLELYNREHDRVAKITVEPDFQEILDFYKENCPHIEQY